MHKMSIFSVLQKWNFHPHAPSSPQKGKPNHIENGEENIKRKSNRRK